MKLSKEQSKKASEILGRLDKVAEAIQGNHQQWGMSFDVAKRLVNHLDKVADDFEASTFGGDSMGRRQEEVLKKAKVLQCDPDESSYMSSFEVDQGVVQADGDEGYMAAYADDQSSAVLTGKSSTGVPLTGKK
jgi:hypothetical protein